MKFYRCLIFLFPSFLLACQPARSIISTQPPPPLSQTEPAGILQPGFSTPSPGTRLTATPSQLPEPSPSPTLPPSLSSLRVVYSDGKNVWLWQSSGATLLTTIEVYTVIKLSDDGEMGAFEKNGQLWVINSDGTGERLLVASDNLKVIEPEASETTLVVNQFDWIPGTHSLLFNTGFLSKMGVSYRDDLHMMDADTLEWRILRDAGEGGAFSISPKGSRVVMVTPSEISIMDIKGTNYWSLLEYSQIDTGSEYYYYADPIWSIDSQSLLVDIPPRDYRDNLTVQKVIWHLFANGNPPVKESQLPVRYRYVFSPDFSKLAYSDLKDNVNEIHIANIDGSEDLIYQPGIEMNFETWSLDSEYFVLHSRQSGEYFLARVGDEPMPLTEQHAQDFLWIDESYFLYKNINNGACELRLGTIGRPSILLDTFALGSSSSDCFKPYDFVQ